MSEDLILQLNELLEAEKNHAQLRYECIRQGEELDRARARISQALHQRKLGTFAVGLDNNETVLCVPDLKGEYAFHKITSYRSQPHPTL